MQYSQKQNLHTAKAQGSSPQLQRTPLMLLALYAQRCLCNGTVSLRLSVCLSVPPIDQGPCRANFHEWGLVQSPSCDRGQRQTVNHIVDTFPFIQFGGALNLLHEANDELLVCTICTRSSTDVKFLKQNIRPTDLIEIRSWLHAALAGRTERRHCLRTSSRRKEKKYKNSAAGCGNFKYA